MSDATRLAKSIANELGDECRRDIAERGMAEAYVWLSVYQVQGSADALYDAANALVAICREPA